MTPRRRALWLAREAYKLPPDERIWILIALLSGQFPPADELQFERNVRIRQYREKWHSHLSERAAADAIAAEAGRYRAAGWRYDQHSASMPPRLRGTKTGDLFAVMKFDDVPNAAMIRKILGTNG